MTFRAPPVPFAPCVWLLPCALLVFDRELDEPCAFALAAPEPLEGRLVGRLSGDLVWLELLEEPFEPFVE